MSCNPRHREVPAPRRDVDAEAAAEAAGAFLAAMRTRRSIRHFSPEPVDPRLIASAVATAATAPSGANRQPWRFVVVADPAVKRKIREAAEEEERRFYAKRAPLEWLDALEPLGTDWSKQHLEDAPYLIVVFEVRDPKPYYAKESVGIAVGLLLASLHLAGLATLTHTPNPMAFLNEILGRPSTERPFVIIPVGRATPDATVPAITRKPLEEVMRWVGTPPPIPSTGAA